MVCEINTSLTTSRKALLAFIFVLLTSLLGALVNLVLPRADAGRSVVGKAWTAVVFGGLSGPAGVEHLVIESNRKANDNKKANDIRKANDNRKVGPARVQHLGAAAAKVNLSQNTKLVTIRNE